MKHIFIATGIVATIATAGSAFSASQFHLNYNVLSEGKLVGTVKQSRSFQSQSPKETVSTVSQIDASGWWGKWSLRAQSRSTFDGFRPISFDHKITENDKSVYVRGAQKDAFLWATAAEVKTDDQMDNEMVAGTAMAIVADLVPPVGLAMSIASLVGGEEKQPGWKVALAEFDVAREQLPTYLMRQKTVPKRIKVIDTETLEISTFSAKEKGTERVAIENHSFDCRVIYLKNKEGEMTYWLSEKDGHIHVIQETGKDADGPYQFTLKGYQAK